MTPTTITSAVPIARTRADQPVEAGLQARDVDADGHPLLAAGAHAVGLEPLAAERLHHGHRRQRLAGHRRDPALVRAPHARRAAHAAAVDPADAEQRRRGGERDQRQHRVEDQQDDGHAEREQQGLRDRPELLREEVAHGVDVAGHAREQVALLALLVEGEREPLEVVVDGDPQLVADPLAGGLQPQVGEVERGGLGQRDQQHEDGDADQRAASRRRRARTAPCGRAAGRPRSPAATAWPGRRRSARRWRRRRRPAPSTGGGCTGRGRGRRGSRARHRREQGRPRVAAHQVPQLLAGAAAAVEVDRRRGGLEVLEPPDLAGEGCRPRAARAPAARRGPRAGGRAGAARPPPAWRTGRPARGRRRGRSRASCCSPPG